MISMQKLLCICEGKEDIKETRMADRDEALDNNVPPLRNAGTLISQI